MKSRLTWFWLGATLGILLLALGWLVPAHIRAVNASVLYAAGKETSSLVQHAHRLLSENEIGAATKLLAIAQAEGMPGREAALQKARDYAAANPKQQYWGGTVPRWAGDSANERKGVKTEPVTEFIVRKENRTRLIQYLEKSAQPGVLALLRCRDLTNTVIFPPSWTSSGQAFDAAVVLGGLLLLEDRLNPAFEQQFRSMVNDALLGGNPVRLEQGLLDLMSLGQRLNWGELSHLTRSLRDVESLRLITSLVRKSEESLSAVYTAVIFSGDASGVTRYMMSFSQTGLRDMRAAMRYNSGGLKLLLDRNKRLRHTISDDLLKHYVPFDFLPVLTWRSFEAAMALKWLSYLAAGYFFGLSVHVLLRRRARTFEEFSPEKSYSRTGSPTERPFDLPPVRGIHVAREVLFALGFLAVILLLTEPYLTQESQKMDFPFRLRLPMAGSVMATVPTTVAKASFMNQLSLLTLALFFVLQALIYTACMFKLAEIRRQKVGPRMKLKLLDNEDHLFDAGLYLGFVGTIISLILVSLGVIKPSLMAAYSSTSFGIIFVSFFKIFNLRPLKRRLLLEAEAVAPEGVLADSTRPQPTP